jgi:hypothetical protein
MPIQVNVQNGSITPAGSVLGPNVAFEWYNPSAVDVHIKYAGNWSIPDSCTVPANGGTVSAQVLPVPNLNGGAFFDSGWNTPGQPHIQVNPIATPMETEREVA